jgi:hypothetical protein
VKGVDRRLRAILLLDRGSAVGRDERDVIGQHRDVAREPPGQELAFQQSAGPTPERIAPR